MEEEPLTKRRPALGCLLEVVETLVLTIVIFVGIQVFVAQPYKVEQVSMENSLMPGQYVLVDKLTPRWAPYSRGDIVVFDPPETWSPGGSVPFIKRVIGVPGDRIELRDGNVFVNDVKLQEPYVFEDRAVSRGTEPTPGGPTEWRVPAGDLFVMGDHRDESADSRIFGPIAVGHVIGRAWLRYWPFDTFGILPEPSYAGL